MYNYSPMSTDWSSELQFYNSYYNTGVEKCPNYLYSTNIDKDSMDVYVITFNNLFCVEYQIKTLRTFIKQKFNIIVIDNNNNLNQENSDRVLDLCKKENITYIKAPNNYFQQLDRFDPSLKLGTTMNWIFWNCVKSREPKYFGYLDQDCFLYKDLDLTEYLDKKNMYGPLSISKQCPPAWNLHVTSNFYRYEYVKDLQLDFRPSHKYILDTGGNNYDLLYKNVDMKDYELDTRGFRYFEHDIGDQNTFQYYTLHDFKWVHMCGSSGNNLQGQVDTKIAYMKGFLDCMLGRTDRSF